MADKCCEACAHGQPCQGCASKSSGSVAPSVPVTSPQGSSPAAMRRRTVTGAHPALVITPRSSGGAVASPSSPVAHDHEHGRSSGVVTSDDPERDAFLQSIRGLSQEQQSTALENWMRRRGESADATRTAVASLLRGGIDTVQQFLRQDSEARLERIRTGAATDMERLRQQGLTDRAEIYARYGYVPGEDPGEHRPPGPPPPAPPVYPPAPPAPPVYPPQPPVVADPNAPKTSAASDSKMYTALLLVAALGGLGAAVYFSGKRGA